MSPEKDIHTRIYSFVLRVLNLVRHLPANISNQRISLQLIDSITSIGANDQEADASESKKDFLAKYSIAKKETKESMYWLKIIYDTNPILQKRMSELLKEGNEILRIISAIILSTKKKI